MVAGQDVGALSATELAARLMTFFTSSQSSQVAQAFPELTAREHEVLDLIAQGLNNQAIATRLSISEKTVRNHISNIYKQTAGSRPGSSHHQGPRSGYGEIVFTIAAPYLTIGRIRSGLQLTLNPF